MATSKLEGFVVYEDPASELHASPARIHHVESTSLKLSEKKISRPGSPPGDETVRPSKLRRHGSRIMSALRSMTNSNNSRDSYVETLPDPAVPSSKWPADTSGTFKPMPSKKPNMPFLRLNMEPTIVHRAVKARAPWAFRPTDDNLIDTADLSPVSPMSVSTSPMNSNESSKSGPNNYESTGITSPMDSKQPSKKSKVSTNTSSDNKQKGPQKQVIPEIVIDSNLPPIRETSSLEVIAVIPEPTPTIVTVEKATTAKIFFECHYNGLLSGTPSPRSMRRRELEGALYEDLTRSPMEKEVARQKWQRVETEHLRETRVMKSQSAKARREDLKLPSKYEVVKVLGKGSFGVVRLVREKIDDNVPYSNEKKKEIYAMKVIRKSDMLRNSQEGHLRAERDFLVVSEGSRWVVPLVASFQDSSNLYLVMEYMPGGDFLGLLIRDNILSEAVTKWYIAEMILCIEEAHSLRWIHRDIKPDNFLISASGHLKISDFGLAFDGHWSHDQSYFNNHRYSLLTKLGLNVEGDSIDKKEGQKVAAAMKLANVMMGGKDRHEKKTSSNGEGEGILNWRNRTGNRTLARSVVGTSQYMAPEVVRGEHYDARCDWWSVAIILYECLYGHTPFLAEEGGRAATKSNIVNHQTYFSFPSKPPVSSRCKDLISRLIVEKSERLCSSRYRHKFLSNTRHQDYSGRYVYANDAEDIKAHRWFKDIDWTRIHFMTPPFIPEMRSVEDTRYFDEEETISDVSSSKGSIYPSPTEIKEALRPFNREIQILATEYVTKPHDTAKLRKIDREIDNFNLGEIQKGYLKEFVKTYGQKEKKRPRDKLLRDKDCRDKVLEVRKRGAFLGYSYRRIKRGGSVRSVKTARGVWHRARLSIP